MNYFLNKDCPDTFRDIQKNRRFNRSQDMNSVSTGKRALSQCASQNSLLKFYKLGSKYTKDPKFVKDFIESISPACQEDDLIITSKKKPKTLTQKFTVDRQNQLDVQKQQLKAEVKRLKSKNKQLEYELENMKARQQIDVNKENKSMNKMRQKTHKQRIKELQSEISQLKITNTQLNDEIREAKNSRLTEETNVSSLDCILGVEQKQQNREQMLVLTEELKKLQLQMDFVNRRNYAQMYTLRSMHQKQIRSLKQKNQELVKSNSELKKKNSDLIYKIKGTREKKTCTFCNSNLQAKSHDLLQLSCSD